MKALFGMVSLLVALAVVGVLVSKQLKATGQGVGAAASGPGALPAGTPSEQSRQMQEKVHKEVTDALEQGARRHEADN